MENTGTILSTIAIISTIIIDTIRAKIRLRQDIVPGLALREVAAGNNVVAQTIVRAQAVLRDQESMETKRNSMSMSYIGN